MLKNSDTPIESVIHIFSERGIDVAFLVPTETGYKKSIMDATISLRNFLKNNNIHDYTLQKQGPDHKKYYNTIFIDSDKAIESTASLYRPKTKNGDPRIWFKNLGQYCRPNNLLALIHNESTIYILNLSNKKILESIEHNGYVSLLLETLISKDDYIAGELLQKLKEIHNMGFVQTITSGPTGVGATCEYLLGIQANSSKSPDYKGIEIKCKRFKLGTRSTLFSQVPDWKKSNITSKILLDKFKYYNKERDRYDLYCTLSAKKPNPQGLYLKVDLENDLLINCYKNGDKEEYVLQWSLEDLRNRLLEKHKETFWITAENKKEKNKEYFKYNNIIHTKKPVASLLGNLIEMGVITVDYLMHFKDNGVVRDHGYLFKIKEKDIPLLFPDPIEIPL